MEPAYRNGSHILVDLRPHDPTALIGKTVAAWINNEEGATIKVLREDETKDYWVLVPANKEYRVRIISKAREDFRVFPIVAVLQSVN